MPASAPRFAWALPQGTEGPSRGAAAQPRGLGWSGDASHDHVQDSTELHLTMKKIEEGGMRNHPKCHPPPQHLEHSP